MSIQVPETLLISESFPDTTPKWWLSHFQATSNCLEVFLSLQASSALKWLDTVGWSSYFKSCNFHSPKYKLVRTAESWLKTTPISKCAMSENRGTNLAFNWQGGVSEQKMKRLNNKQDTEIFLRVLNSLVICLKWNEKMVPLLSNKADPSTGVTDLWARWSAVPLKSQ